MQPVVLNSAQNAAKSVLTRTALNFLTQHHSASRLIGLQFPRRQLSF